jgi:exosortase
MDRTKEAGKETGKKKPPMKGESRQTAHEGCLSSPDVFCGAGEVGKGWVIMAMAPSWLAMAWLVSKAQWFWTHRPDLQFGWAVLILAVYLIQEAWQRRPAPVYQWCGMGALSALAGGLLLFMVQIYQAAFGVMAASVVGLAAGVAFVVAANLLYVFGRPGLKHFGFAFGFIWISLPMPSAVQNFVVAGLQRGITEFNVWMLNFLGIPARQSGSLIQLPAGIIGVDEACSGIRSLQATLMVTLFIGYTSVQPWSWRVLLVLVGAGLALVGNMVRSMFLSLMVSRNGIESIDRFHDVAGWAVFVFTACGVGITCWGMNRLATEWEE